MEIKVNLLKRRLHFFKFGREKTSFPIAIGKSSTPTPPGSFQIINKIVNPGGILGTRWLGLNIPGGNYGIHGTSQPRSIGRAVSNGCIRMYNRDIEYLFPLVSMGTKVIIDTAFQNSQPSPPYREYIVQPGDTLWKIAQKKEVGFHRLLEINRHISNPNIIHPGQVVYLPPSTKSA